jgi:hypothetical protein
MNSIKKCLSFSRCFEIISSSCFNKTCQLITNDQLDSLIVYAIAIDKEHEDYAHYLINRSDSCVPISRSIYRLWLKWTLNMTTRTQLFQV